MISDEKSQPTFSILIPTYNRVYFLQKCIESILESDFNDYEVIFSDDCSPQVEEIAKILEPYLKKHRNISFFRQPQNLGWSENRNFLVKNAKGKYVILMGDDDKLVPSALRRIKYFLDKNPGRHIYAFGFTVIDEEDNYCYTISSPLEFEIHLDKPELSRLLFSSNIIPFWVFHPFTMCYERSISEEIVYIKEAHIGDDILFLMDCVRSGKRIFVIPESLFLWRKAQKLRNIYRNLSSDGMNNIIARRNIISIMKRRIGNSSHIFSNLVSAFQFRKSFLYDSIILNGYAQEEILKNLELGFEYSSEILILKSRGPLLLYKLKWRSGYLYDFIELFGMKGIACLINRLIEKVRYRLLWQLISVSEKFKSVLFSRSYKL